MKILKIKRKHFPVIGALFLLLWGLNFSPSPAQAEGKNWFVRPYGASYNSQNGSSYDNAWAGLDKVVWGENGMKAGDTLWVCSRHGDVGSGQMYLQTILTVGAFGTEAAPTTIRGDCSTLNAGYENGEMRRTNFRIPAGGASWTDTGTNGVYKRTQWGSVGSVYEERQLMSRTEKTCSSPATPEELNNFQPGDWCKITDTFYLKPLRGSSNPNDHTYLAALGWAVANISNQQYITIKNIDMVNGHISLTAAQHITIDNVHIKNSSYGVEAHGKCDYFAMRDSSIDMVGDGIYFIINYPDLESDTDHVLIEHSSITNVEPIGEGEGAQDCHAIRFQGGLDYVIRYNYFENVSTAVTGYGSGTGTRPEEIHYPLEMDVYGNFAKHVWRWGTGTDGNTQSGHGCAYDYHGPTKAFVSVKIHDNIAIDVANSGIRVNPSGDVTEIYNNVIDSANIGITTSSYQGIGKYNKANIRNNIITNPKDFGRGLPVVFQYMVADELHPAYFVSDHNIYFPNANSGNYFFCKKYSSSPMSFSDWKTRSNNQEPNSKLADPLFTNANGNFSQASDFQLSATSPAIDAGADVGLTKDYAGNSVPQGSAPDIGAYEHSASAPPTFSSADINQDNLVNLTDLDILKTDFLKATANLANSRSDIDQDGQATVKDVGILMSGWR